ncbi:tripeptidyl peptidase [Cordyceps militaris CM01]|uniref:tripeptidyl-peptidase II n=1 Tax=Cordyceps militaris (strain CM01) TaxID=983644 RepID=G3JAH5_CORMM|nr:tripeptidyl peptidase [Cordyceps militaris CM01]EGX94291.1 tripeptidyl peptidase [Cordyceps militaris CM01]
MMRRLLVFAGLFAYCCALPAQGRITESSAIPPAWRKLRPASDAATVNLQIGVKHDEETMNELKWRLYEVSDPRSHSYGRHLGREEMAALFRAPDEAVASIERWLLSSNVTSFTKSAGNDWITASLPVRQVEELLRCRYFEFENVHDGTVLVRTTEWSLPAHVAPHVDVVQPTDAFFRPKPSSRYGGPPPPDWEQQGRLPTHAELVEEDVLDRGHLDVPTIDELPENPSVDDACNRLAVTPLCMRVLYGTLSYAAQSAATNRMGVVNFLGNNNNRSDIRRYLELYRPDAAAAGAAEAFDTELVAGADDRQTPNTAEQFARHMGLEGALDVETMLGIGHPTPLTTWNVGGQPPFRASAAKVRNGNEPYMEWLHHLLAQEHLPSVISVSYADEEQTVPEAYARRVCAAFAQLGARGVSVLVASGDEGVGKDGLCVTNDGRNATRFMPAFPASCPYVTAVGATRHFTPVMAAFDGRSDFVTGGGFSEYFARPSYQDAAVDGYLRGIGALHDGLYNAGGRAVPDISAQGYHYTIIYNGTAHLLDGTSGSAPTVAAIVALLNDALLAEKKPPLGFLNPWLYAAKSGLRDVLHGAATGCNTTGFPAAPGWDAATGLGTPVRIGLEKRWALIADMFQWFPELKDLALARRSRWDHPWYIV